MPTIPGELTKLAISDNGSSWTDVAEVSNITPPGGTVDEVETTVLGLTHKRYRPSKIIEAGEVSFTLLYDPNLVGHQAIAELVTVAPVAKHFKITYDDGMATPANDTFQGFIRGFEPGEMSPDGSNYEASVTIRISGGVTRNPGVAGGG